MPDVVVDESVDVVALYRAGVPFRVILARCGHTPRYVYTRLRRAGVTPDRQTRYNDIDADPATHIVRLLRSEGHSIRSIGRAIGKSADSVMRRLEEAKPSSRRWVTKDEVAKMKALRKRGLSISQIARCVGRGPQTVSDHIHGMVQFPHGRPIKKPKRAAWPMPDRTPAEAYAGRMYEDQPNIPVGDEYKAIRIAQVLVQRA